MLKFERKNLSEQTGEIRQILDGSITGVVFENALTQNDCIELLQLIEQLKPAFFTDLNHGNGFSLPGMFGQLHSNLPLSLADSYFANVQPFTQAADKSFGKNLGNALHTVLNKAFAPYPVKALNGFLPYSFRVVFEGKGGLSLHKDGDLLPYIHEHVSKQITAAINPQTMMSWFFTLQEPGSGGALWVADSDYSNDSYESMTARLGNTSAQSAIAHLDVKTPAGSLLMFRGGNHWHSVIPPANGEINRVTLGGFMALSKDGNEIIYWS